jgi:glycine hydroxymethyltransferase
MIDYEQVATLAEQHKPKLIVAGASAYPRRIDFERFGQIARSVGAKLMVDMAHIAGLVVAGEHPSPVPHADYVTTTTHKTLRGPRGGLILCKAEYKTKIDSRVCPTTQGGPLCHIIAAKAVALKEAMSDEFKAYQHRIIKNAQALAKALLAQGFNLVSGGTDNHLMLVDLRPKKITGKLAEKSLEKAGITVNKNMIPNDPEKPLVTSGIRIGTPALTTRGMDEAAMLEVAALMAQALDKPEDEANLAAVRAKVNALAERFPLYPEMTREM